MPGTIGSLRNAVDLVLRDVTAALGADAVVVAITSEADSLALLEVSNPGLLDTLTTPGFGGFSEVDAWVYVPGDIGAIGLYLMETEPFARLVVRTAETIQEAVIESIPYYGAAFPSCPAHRIHPIWPEVRDGTAVWACPSDHAIAVRVGTTEVPPPARGASDGGGQHGVAS